jgi:hypothetical protein
MAENNRKVGNLIDVVYQSEKAQTGLTVTMEIFDETHAKDVVNFPDVTMSELGSSGRYVGSFTPDAVGTWIVMLADGSNKGKIVRIYEVGTKDLSTLSTEISTTESNIRGTDNDTLKDLSDQIDAVGTPAMLG